MSAAWSKQKKNKGVEVWLTVYMFESLLEEERVCTYLWFIYCLCRTNKVLVLVSAEIAQQPKEIKEINNVLWQTLDLYIYNLFQCINLESRQ